MTGYFLYYEHLNYRCGFPWGGDPDLFTFYSKELPSSQHDQEVMQICLLQWSTGGRILTGAGEPQFSRGRGWPLKLDRGRGTLNFAGAGGGGGGGGSIPKCSQKVKPEFDNNLENCRNTEYDRTTLMLGWLCNL